jgi:YHS domain-containing protein
MRLLILAGLVYLAYRAMKSWMRIDGRPSERRSAGPRAGEVDDIMVKDPFCEAYFPKRNGVSLTFEGRELLFCSKECRDKFVALHSK